VKKLIFDMGDDPVKREYLDLVNWLFPSPKPTQETLDGSPWTRPLGRPCPEPSNRRLVD
jgi:hypothetical protein